MDDKALKQLLDAGVPGVDANFTIAVMARIERRQFHRSLLRAAGAALALGVVLAVAAPFLDDVMTLLAKPLANDWVIAGLLLAAGTLAYLRWPIRDWH
jgi:hypothetical protein